VIDCFTAYAVSIVSRPRRDSSDITSTWKVGRGFFRHRAFPLRDSEQDSVDSSRSRCIQIVGTTWYSGVLVRRYRAGERIDSPGFGRLRQAA
jgi:hypothetical protein